MGLVTSLDITAAITHGIWAVRGGPPQLLSSRESMLKVFFPKLVDFGLTTDGNFWRKYS